MSHRKQFIGVLGILAGILLLGITTFLPRAAADGEDRSVQDQGASAEDTSTEGAKNPYKNLPFTHPPDITGVLPRTVPFLSDAPDEPVEARPFFDNFSWRSFVALSWPADPKDRGQPLGPKDKDTFYKAPNGTEVVWGAYREVNDLFGQGGDKPPAWDGGAGKNPCDPAKGTRSFIMVTKSGSVFDEINESFSFPLIDQNKNYAFFEVRFNQSEYSFIRDKGLYLVKNLAKAEPVTMPESQPGNTTVPNWVGDGSIMTKAAWRLMTKGDIDRGRYYMINAQLFFPDPPTDEEQSEGTSTDPANVTPKGKCVPAKMGLVGLHIARKVKDFPQWIWSTFEQVDNVSVPAGVDFKPSFNNGTSTPKTVGGWANRPAEKSPALQPKSERTPVQVTRLNPIPTTPEMYSTADLNAVYQKAMKSTVWQYYELVETQWPTSQEGASLMEDGGIYPQNCGHAFPVDGVVNTTMETYMQSKSDAVGAGGNSCMSCHYRAGQADFSWVLMQRSHS